MTPNRASPDAMPAETRSVSNRASHAGERFLEAVGPIVVKEVRQGLRARVFAICFGLLLVACLVTSLVAAAEVREEAMATLGPQYLTLFLCGLAVVCFFVIPYTAYRSMAREREEETWVLLALTGLSSRRIVRGKVASAFTQALLYSSVGAPFILFSYFLNGVDLPTLVLEVFFAACWAFALTSIAVALGTEGHSRIGRALTHFLVLGILGAATVGGMAFGASFAREGSRWLGQDGFVVFCFVFPTALLTTSVLITEGAAAGLSLASEASVKGARLVFAGQLVVAIAATYLAVSATPSTSRDLVSGFSVMSSMFLAAFGFFSVSERDGFPRTQPNPGWLTAGALRGWGLTQVGLIVMTAAWFGLYLLIPDASTSYRAERHLYSLLAAPLYAGLYLSVAAVLGRWPPFASLGQPLATRTAFLASVLVAAVMSPVVALMMGERANDKVANAFNPIFGMVNFLERMQERHAVPILMLLGLAWFVWSAIAWVVLARRDTKRIA